MQTKGNGALMWSPKINGTKILKIWSTFELTYISIENCDSFVTDLFVCANMLVDTPVTTPATANTPLASAWMQERKKTIEFRAKSFHRPCDF